jgi:predicted ABC-type ATPase
LKSKSETTVPDLFIIAGPNGAGKTAYARRFLPEEMRLREFVNADLIAAGLSPFAPDRAAYEAGRLMLRRLRELAERREDFAFETTLSGRAYAPLLEELRASGYRISLDFLWIPELGVTRQRVRQRVSKGGHDVPDGVQYRRFHLGLRNLTGLYRPLLRRWRLYDNTSVEPHLVAEEEEGRITVADVPLLATIERIASVRLMPGTPPAAVEEPIPYSSAESTRRSMRAMRKAFADAVLENLRYGLPVIQYRDGKVVEIPAEELAPLARSILAANGEPLPPEPQEIASRFCLL